MNEVATAIFEQLGGNNRPMRAAIKAMVYGPKSLTLKLKQNPKRISDLRVTLNDDDTYTMEAFRFTKKATSFEPIASESGLFCHMIQDEFEDMTGILTTFFARR